MQEVTTTVEGGTPLNPLTAINAVQGRVMMANFLPESAVKPLPSGMGRMSKMQAILEYKMSNHAWKKKYKYIPWCVCIHCGLIQLNNEATRKKTCEIE